MTGIATVCGLVLGSAAAAPVTAATGTPQTTSLAGSLPASGASWGNPLLVPDPLDAGGDSNVGSISCTAPGDCAIAGSYADVALISQAFVDDEKNGTWQSMQEVPGTAALNYSGAGAASVSCASPGNCAVGGAYQAASGEDEGFVASEVRGTWHNAAPVRGTVGQYAAVDSVSCPAAGDCVAAGYFTNRAGDSEAFVAGQSHGTWGSEITVAGRLNAAGDATASSVSCASAGNCVAGGYYLQKDKKTEAFIVAERHGVWSAAKEVAGALNAGGQAAVSTVSCRSAGNCGAAGSYTDRAGHTQAFVVTEKDGGWSAAHEVAGALNTGGQAAVSTISCPSTGNCAAGGSYTGTGKRQEAFVVGQRRGVWSSAVEVAGALNIGGQAAVSTISCPSAGNCAGGGYYVSIYPGAGEAYVVTERDGTWLPASEIAAALDTVGGGAAVEAVSCVAVSDCTATGEVNDDSGLEIFAVTGAITQPTSTTLSLSAARVSYGHEQSERLSISVRARYRGIPAGRVLVKAGPATICAITLKAGAGRCALAARELRAGTYHLTAAYAGGAGYFGSATARKTLTVAG